MSPRPVRRRLPAAQRQRQIVQTARRHFARFGYDGLVMKSVAAECGVTEAALYRYFASKEALYEAVIRDAAADVDIPRLLAPVADTTDVGRLLLTVARAILRIHVERPELARLLFHCSLDNHPLCEVAFRDLRAPFVNFLARRLRQLIAAGVVRRVNPDITARCFVGMVMDCGLSAELWAGIQGRAFSRDASVRNNVAIYERGLVP